MSLRVADEASAADWLRAGVRGFAESVCSLVPTGFPAYVRVFHPAARACGPGSEAVAVRWEAIAAACGKVAHPAMQLPWLTGVDQYRAELPGVFDANPAIGTLPPELARPLAATLSRHTSTPARCWFAVWDGFGGMPSWVREAPRFRLPARGYFLLTGPVERASANFLGGLRGQSANLWWPDDRAWCAATDIDLNSTYVGCDHAACRALLALTGLEATAIPPSTGIDRDSDLVNAAAGV